MPFNGYNGTILYAARDVPVGNIPGNDYGYRQSLPVTVNVRIEQLERQSTYETVDHQQISNPLDFAITSDIWQPQRGDIIEGGATVEPLTKVIKSVLHGHSGRYARGMNRATVEALVSLEEWHLNAMTAGCSHQTVVWEDEPYRQPSLTLTKPCPITGYRYGHAWLVRPLPDDLVDRVRALFAEVDPIHIFDITNQPKDER